MLTVKRLKFVAATWGKGHERMLESLYVSSWSEQFHPSLICQKLIRAPFPGELGGVLNKDSGAVSLRVMREICSMLAQLSNGPTLFLWYYATYVCSTVDRSPYRGTQQTGDTWDIAPSRRLDSRSSELLRRMKLNGRRGEHLCLDVCDFINDSWFLWYCFFCCCRRSSSNLV